MKRTLTVAGLKGGVGKTTSAVNLAAELAARGWRVRLLDLDPQASATLSLGVEPAADPFGALPVVVELDLERGSLEVAPGGRALARADEARAGQHIENAGRGVELLVVDTPPTLSPLMLAALKATDAVLAPVEATPLSLPSLRDLGDLLASLDAPPRLLALLVRVQARRTLTGDVEELLAREFPHANLPVTVPEDVRAAEAPGFGVPLLRHARSSRAGVAYRQAAELLEEALGMVSPGPVEVEA